MVRRDGFLEIGHLFPGNIAGNIPAVFVTLVIVIGPLRALADDAEHSSIQALDLGDVIEDRSGSGCCIHYEVVYALHIYYDNKKRGELHLEDSCRAPDLFNSICSPLCGLAPANSLAARFIQNEPTWDRRARCPGLRGPATD